MGVCACTHDQDLQRHMFGTSFQFVSQSWVILRQEIFGVHFHKSTASHSIFKCPKGAYHRRKIWLRAKASVAAWPDSSKIEGVIGGRRRSIWT